MQFAKNADFEGEVVKVEIVDVGIGKVGSYFCCGWNHEVSTLHVYNNKKVALYNAYTELHKSK